MKKELKFEDISMTDFIRMAKKNGYEVQINEDKKLAIECLKEIKEDISLMTDLSMIKETEHKTAILNFYKDIMQVINAIIDNKIKELEEKNG